MVLPTVVEVDVDEELGPKPPHLHVLGVQPGGEVAGQHDVFSHDGNDGVVGSQDSELGCKRAAGEKKTHLRQCVGTTGPAPTLPVQIIVLGFFFKGFWLGSWHVWKQLPTKHERALWWVEGSSVQLPPQLDLECTPRR